MHLFTAQVKLCTLITIPDSAEILGNKAQKFKKTTIFTCNSQIDNNTVYCSVLWVSHCIKIVKIAVCWRNIVPLPFDSNKEAARSSRCEKAV